MPRPPRPMARPIGVSLGSAIVGARAVQPREKRARADVGQQFDRRQVERLLQRAPRRHRPLEAEIEILRRIGAVARGAVEQDRLGMREPLLERHRVDERLQRRARRARLDRHVDGAVARGVRVVGGADAGADLAAGVVDRDDGDGQLRAEPLGVLARRAPRACAAGARRSTALFVAPACRRRPPPPPHGRRAAGTRGVASGSARRRRLRPRARRSTPRASARCQHMRAGARARRRRACRAAALPAPAAAPPAAPLRRCSAGAAPCRNRRARRRARLRDCRRTAPASDSGRARRPCRPRARSARRAPSAAAWRRSERSRGSINRATCMVSVEAPETTRPCVAICHAARPSAQASRRRRAARKRASS